MLTSLFISFCAGSFLVKNEKKKFWWGVLIALVVAFNFLYFRPEKFLKVNDSDLLRGENWDRQIKRSIFDYLPIYAKEPPAELAKESYQILTGDSRVFDFRSGTNWINFKTETNSHTIIRISQYYFPNWKVFIDGKEEVLEYKNNNLGLMTIILGKGTHDISLKLFDTRIRSFANALTLTTAILIVLLFVIQLGKVRSWIEYYRKRIY